MRRLGLLVALAAAVACGAAPAVAAGGAIELPQFNGRTLDGRALATSSFAGKRLVVLCFNPGLDQAEAFAEAVANVSPLRSRHNFAIVGVALGMDPDGAAAFARRLGLDFPIFDDADARITTTLGLRTPLVLLGVDSAGTVGLTLGSLEAEEARPAAVIEDRLRSFLRLPAAGEAPSPVPRCTSCRRVPSPLQLLGDAVP